MEYTDPNKTPKTIIKFLKDPSISPELKDMCFRLVTNPFIRKLLKKTPASAIFEICREYKKNPDLYDDIFNGRIRFFLKGSMNESLPLFNYKKTNDECNLKEFIGPSTLTGQVVEKFIACDALNKKIIRIMVKMQGDKLLTTAFDSNNKVVSMLIDQEAKSEGKIFINFLKSLANQRIDFIRI